MQLIRAVDASYTSGRIANGNEEGSEKITQENSVKEDGSEEVEFNA
jgi:hypothetical protein